MRTRWGEPVIVLRLADPGRLGFDVPGRRNDGTVRGRKLVRHFFVYIGRGIRVAVLAVLWVMSGGAGGGGGSSRGGRRRRLFDKEIRVRGLENAMVLDLVDRLRSAKGPWLVCSPRRLAVVDTGSTITDPAGAPRPKVIWEAGPARVPAISFATRTITWPDGSTFTFPLHGRTEEQHLRRYHEFPDTVDWNGGRDVAG